LLQMIMWVMSIMALSTSGMISSSIGCNAPWLGNLNH
jgi:tellurite resistance protein TehA-like permease